MIQSRELLASTCNPLLQLHLLLVLQIMLFLRDIAAVLEEPLCEGMVLSLDPIVFPLANRDVE